MIAPRKAVQALKAYQPPLEGRRGLIRLDFNENTTGFPWACEHAPPDLLTAYPEYDAFTSALAETWGIPANHILLANASDEALFVISFTFIEPDQDTAVLSKPTFSLIPHYLKLVQARLTEVSITDGYEFDIAGIEAALAQGAKLAMLASPDNPVGCSLPVETIRRWCETFPQTLFVIDEAYAEYAGASVLPMVQEFGNLLVTRTFSKAWGLAGLRLGAVIGQPQLIEAMQRVRSPYSVNSVAVATAIRMLPRAEEVRAAANDTMARKAQIVGEVKHRGYRVVEGQANFFMLHLGLQAEAFCRFFRERGILVRDRSGFHKLSGMVRVSVGSPQEMTRFLETLDAWRNARALMFDMDGTLVDTRESFDATVAAMVERHSDQSLKPGELTALRAEGGFNDDWDATIELLRRRGVTKTYDEIQEEATRLYLSLAPQTETWLVEPTQLAALGQRFRLAVVTGRCRAEYDPVWRTRFEPLFEEVICQDDCPGALKKPEPDLLHAAMTRMGVEGGIYVGNSVDDMRAAQAAGLRRIAVTTTHNAERLRNAGAEAVIDSLNALGDWL